MPQTSTSQSDAPSPDPRVGLEHLEDEELRQQILGLSVTMVKGRLMLGRFQLEILRRDLLFHWGYSSLNQFASLYLRVSPTEAKEARRVARRLVGLPLLSEAAEAGRLRWTHLGEVLRVATADTEEEWLELALRLRYRPLRRVVNRALAGLETDEMGEDVGAERIRFEMEMIPEEAELQQGAISVLSTQAGRPLTAREAHMEMYRSVVEGRIRTSARGVVETAEVLEDMKRMRQEQDDREMARVWKEVEGTPAAEGPAPGPAPAAEGLAPDPASAAEGPAPDPGPPFVKVDRYVVADGASLVLEGLPELPWAAAMVEESACPGNADVVVATPTRHRHFVDYGCNCPDCADQRSRHIPRAVRRQVLRRDGFRCACPDCTHVIWIDLHHLVFWCVGGLNVPDNLIVLCRRCHRNLHKGRLRIVGKPSTGLTFLDSRGRVLGATTAAEEASAAAFADAMLDVA